MSSKSPANPSYHLQVHYAFFLSHPRILKYHFQVPSKSSARLLHASYTPSARPLQILFTISKSPTCLFFPIQTLKSLRSLQSLLEVLLRVPSTDPELLPFLPLFLLPPLPPSPSSSFLPKMEIISLGANFNGKLLIRWQFLLNFQ